MIDRDCPRCGCPDVLLVGQSETAGQVFVAGQPSGPPMVRRRETLRCRLCGHRFTITTPFVEPAELDALEDPPPDGDDLAVPYFVTRCPACGSTDCPVRHTARPKRYHKCRDCGKTFTSIERFSNAPEEDPEEEDREEDAT